MLHTIVPGHMSVVFETVGGIVRGLKKSQTAPFNVITIIIIIIIPSLRRSIYLSIYLSICLSHNLVGRWGST